MVEHIKDFQKLNIRANDIPQEHRIDAFIRILKDNIQHEVQTLTSSISPNIEKVLDTHSKVQAMEDHIEHQQQVLQLLKYNLTLAQNKMKQ